MSRKDGFCTKGAAGCNPQDRETPCYPEHFTANQFGLTRLVRKRLPGACILIQYVSNPRNPKR
jgi:hypothetical protein